ncbi:hypothetical protein RN001_007508 [Aquatica leii]|uniref:Circadian clock-controlled protein n=1 Tax=Aquatica leii TaxID=1421715 RepID=A0AAN7SFE1_9COLE|nr:hypothetical protein RN001_007508 [Aquatica leii]
MSFTENNSIVHSSAVEELRPYLVKGVPDLKLPSIEPLIMNELISEESAGLHLTADNVKAYGCSDFFVRDVRMNFEEQTYEYDVDLPLLRIEAHYNITGKILMMPIKGEGPLQANVTNCKSKTKLKGELYEKEGEIHVRYKEMTVHVTIGGGEVKVENLFNGDKLLNDIVNDSINKNFDSLLNELLPVIERALGTAFLDISNAIVEPYTFKQLFPH